MSIALVSAAMFFGSPQVPVRGIPRSVPTRRLSVFAPGFRPALPGLGLEKIDRVRVTPKMADRIRDLEKIAPAVTGGKKTVRDSGTVSAFGASERVLVLYDNWGQYKFMGELYGRQMADLVSHFGYGIDLVPVQDYKLGMVTSHRATIYIGALFDTNLPSAFKLEAMAALKPVCWVGANLWKIAWTPTYQHEPTFEWRFGFKFEGMDGGFNTVNYKSTDLGKLDTTLSKIDVTSTTKAKVVATARNASGVTEPYITRSGNFWFVGDNPLSTVAYGDQDGHDRTLAFCDVLHDVLGSNAATSRKGLVRIEDVSAMADPVKLRQIADILDSEDVPFVVSTIPIYRDPLGYYNSGIPFELELADAPAVLDALKYMESKGGQIIQHGTTHQIDDLPNPYYGISGSDWEFFRVVYNEAGNMEFWGPVWGDSETWVKDRIETGRKSLQRAGFDPKGWLTPHYLASPVDYDYFATAFEYSLCPTLNFTLDSAGYLFYQALNAPYPTRDHRGAVHLPETLSYISPGTPNMEPQNIINRARKMKVVRDGWAGFFFHPYLDPELLRTAVRGVKAEGYKFVNPSREFAPKPQ
ncbi:MAG: DUF2334 domain-containing protein [Fimbriimonas sp.]